MNIKVDQTYFGGYNNSMRGQIQINRYRSGSAIKAYHNQKEACKNYTEISDARRSNYYKGLDLKTKMENGKFGSQKHPVGAPL